MAMQALVMGFGGTGAQVLTYLKEIAVLKQGENPEGVGFLLFDTIGDWQPGKTVSILGGAAEELLAAGHEEGTSLDPVSEYYYLQDHPPQLDKHVFNLLDPRVGQPERHPHLKDWLHIHWVGRHVAKDKLNIKEGAAQQRQIGRFAMFQNAPNIIQEIQRKIRELSRGSANVNVWIIGSSAGGTGAGTLLDAAHMTRIATAGTGIGVNITGVIVLPDVYADKEGISKARAYSLFRELERFQEMNFGLRSNHRYVMGNSTVSSDVQYDARGTHRSRVESALFDNLFYIGRDCRNNGDRETFFSTVANGLDPYLDESQGRDLLQASVNKVGYAASAFGAARLYIPIETYKSLFAWEEVTTYLEGITAPKKERDLIKSVYYGAAGDRDDSAIAKVKKVLPLFENLFDLHPKGKAGIEKYGKSESLTPEMIVSRWYQFGGSSIAGIDVTPADHAKIRFAYVNPYFSITEPEEARVSSRDKAVKTYQENKEAKGGKESQEESRDRFAGELDAITKRYTRPGGAQGTFSEGAKQILNMVSAMLDKKVDELINNQLESSPSAAWEAGDPEKGTTMTRLYQELAWIIAEEGPLAKISEVLAILLDSLNQEEGFRKDQAIIATTTLRAGKKTGFWGTWVEEPQRFAREECTNYIRWYQKRELLRDMQKLTDAVRGRFKLWYDGFRGLVESIAIRRAEERPALYVVQQEISRLEGRLHRLARNGSALISARPNQGADRDVNMQGYRDELKRHGVGEPGLAEQAWKLSQWKPEISGQGRIQLSLKIEWENDAPLLLNTPNALRNLHKTLYERFRRIIDSQLEDRDIFDYLVYARETHNVSLKEVAEMLSKAAGALINTRASASVQWVYKEPVQSQKQDVAANLQGELRKIDRETQSPATLYSDTNALTLLRICQPAPDEISELNECKDAYLAELVQPETGDFHHDETLYRSQVYHPFRAELEAWYIERHYAQLKGENLYSEDLIPPRITRMLEHPDMMQAFVECVATKVVEKDARDIWVFHDANNGRAIDLTTEREPTADVVRAAVVFVLQQREGKTGGRVQITYANARDSAVAAAKTAGKNKDDMVEEFVQGNSLDVFLEEHFGDSSITKNQAIAGADKKRQREQQEKHGLKLIFQFYGDRRRRTDLEDRMELP
ncbi:MAG: hypothetical protein GY862_01995 [Gammaproteobacteria bacterium]|nr:hypothetical protein [Gammaproteobacteria bacterium]